MNSGQMVPLYDGARIHLGPGDFVHVRCMACGHDEIVSPSGLLVGLRLPPETLILDLEPRFRCRECDAKGKAVVMVKWA
ncbi:MAG: hypothetical protein WB611_04225 [Stellaceae bacterium]